MLKMSFFNGTLDKEKLKDFIARSNKEIRYTYGLAYKNPTTYKVLISKNEAFDIINKESMLDATEFEDYLNLNAYSANDLL